MTGYRRLFFRNAPTLIRLGEAVADVCWPRECPFAESFPDERGGFRFLSAELVSRLPLANQGPWCLTCGHPLYGSGVTAQRCEHCDGLGPVYESGRTVMLAKGAGRALLHEFKYRAGGYLSRDLAVLACRTPGYAERLEGAVLVPVPLHPAKEADRGYNQSALFARALAARIPGVDCLPVLGRVSASVSQTRLGRAARRASRRSRA